jgi:serine/threonine protein kinase
MVSSQNLSRSQASGRRYGNYVVLQDAGGQVRELGRGSFGRTYLAQHTGDNTFAALKVISQRFSADPAVRARFLREQQALQKLDHPHIARLLDCGEAGGELFLAVEYCPGGDMARRVEQQGPLRLDDWLRVARQLAGALEYCHRTGFIHRDIKPSNVLLADSAREIVVKLGDFGLVDASGSSPGSADRPIGTPAYASPEQLRGEAVDARSDLFSLGMTLLHLANGQPTDSGPAAQVISRRLSADSLAPKVPQSLPPEAQQVLARLVEKKKEKRPASAVEILAALGNITVTKSIPTKKAESRAGHSRPADSRPAQSRPAGSHPSQSHPSQGRPADSRAADSRASQSRAADSHAAQSPPQRRGASEIGQSPAGLLSEDVLSSLDTHIGPPPMGDSYRRRSGTPIRASTWVVLFVLACLAAGGGYWYLHPSSEGGGSAIPPFSVLKLAGELPAHTTWTVGGTAVSSAAKEDHTEIPLPARKELPAEVLGKAPGYKPFHVNLPADRDAFNAMLKEAVEMSPERATGALVISRGGPCDYGNLAAQMLNALPTETDSVPVSRITLSKTLPGTTETVRWDLPTGVYQLSLVGLRTSVNTRPFQVITIQEGKEETCQLPATFAGRYSGKVSGPDGEGTAELMLFDTLTEGVLHYRMNFLVEHVRVNSKGVLTATAKSNGSRSEAGDLSLSAKLSKDGGQLEVKLGEVFSPDRNAPGNTAAAGGERVQTGTLQRVSSGKN